MTNRIVDDPKWEERAVAIGEGTYDYADIGCGMAITVSYAYLPAHPELATVRLLEDGTCSIKENARVESREHGRKEAFRIIETIMEARLHSAEKRLHFIRKAHGSMHPDDVISSRKEAEA